MPGLRELFAKPLNPPKALSFVISVLQGDPAWRQLAEGSVQLRPMAALWGSPAIRLRGIHVNPQCEPAKAALAAAPFMLEWLQLGILEIHLPSPLAVLLPTPLSPGVKLSVKDVYLRMRTYGAPQMCICAFCAWYVVLNTLSLFMACVTRRFLRPRCGEEAS